MKKRQGKVAAIIVAAGQGVRMGAVPKKQFALLDGIPVLAHTLLAFHRCPLVEDIFLVTGRRDPEICEEKILRPFSLESHVRMVEGGKTRQESVYNGLKATRGMYDVVTIHDGVRPLVPVSDISNTIENADTFGGAIVAVPANDTVKTIRRDSTIIKTIERDTVCLAQTPQTFFFDVIYDAHLSARNEGYEGTDDASLVERRGGVVKIIPGSRKNIKITTPDDLLIAEMFMQQN